MLARFLPLLILCHAAECAAVNASGRNWQVSIDRIECAAAALAVGLRIRYLGPKGPVEAPLSYLTDGKGREHPPRSLVWNAGAKQHAEWLSAGGLRDIQSEDIGEFRLNFDLRDAAGDVRLEFGDIPAFPLTRKRKSGCDGVLAPGQLHVPRAARRPAPQKLTIRIYRGAYPCSAQSGARTLEAPHPPYLPRQLLLFGRGYLPNARAVELPMGKVPAQSYAYVGSEHPKPLDDFPEYASGRYFFFAWGLQKAASGNDAYSIGIYELRACPS
jgi:hypothetical protein